MIPDNRPSRQKISTHVKFLASINALPAQYLLLIHRSQLSRYRNEFRIHEHLGYELHQLSEHFISGLKEVNESHFHRQVIRGYMRFAITLRRALTNAREFHKILLRHKDEIVDAVQRVRRIIPVKNCATLLGVGESTLRSWITSVRVRCSGSLVNLCRKVHPNQLLERETTAMKKLLEDAQFRFWPLISLYYHAKNNNIVTMALSTWYKYAALLNVKRSKPLSLKHWGKSVVASRPNEYWHADVTQFRTQDNELHYIYLVVDNFSKMILAWAVDTKLSAQIRARTFREALARAIQIDPGLDTINLVVDGGSENNNQTVDAFIASISEVKISKIRALKDVRFSNAMAEASNRILKTYYLNRTEIFDTIGLIRMTRNATYDLNEVRPHGQLNGLTPLQVQQGKTADQEEMKRKIQEARQKRTEINRKNGCQGCMF